ncbi:Wzz/FepE/Etk N-terminal domain-containing protein [Aquabacterium sp. NJ1]|uniref:Wzz/FepE/Etk N-terminal domain-containing protein n=1 Tax=Aquabacterium sp. NJ1 TaxID=1538295 RepID=UPI00068AABA3|nr:Wzz/FepE/Etk N-terminal domain-containing protein [Aquabacterium sp. NJ1]
MGAPKTALGDDVRGELTPQDIVDLIASNRRMLVAVPLAAGLLAGVASFAVPKQYAAETAFMAPQSQTGVAASMLQSLGALSGLASSVADVQNPLDQYVALLKSRTIADALIKQFDLKTRYEVTLNDDARLELASRTTVISGKDSIVRVAVEDRDPVFSAKLTNAYVDQLRVLLGRLAITEAQQRRAFFEQQLQKTRANLDASENKLRNAGIDPATLKVDPSSAVRFAADLAVQIAQAKVQLDVLGRTLTPTASEYRSAQAQLDSMLKMQSSYAKGGEGGSDAQKNYINSYREYKYQETLFQMYAQQYELARIDEAKEGSGVLQVLDAAAPPERKSKPRRLVWVIAGILLGFSAVVGTVFGRDWSRRQGLRWKGRGQA